VSQLALPSCGLQPVRPAQGQRLTIPELQRGPFPGVGLAFLLARPEARPRGHHRYPANPKHGGRYIQTVASTLSINDRQSPSFPKKASTPAGHAGLADSHAHWETRIPGPAKSGIHRIRDTAVFGTGLFWRVISSRVGTPRLGLAQVLASHQNFVHSMPLWRPAVDHRAGHEYEHGYI
jgi:hypothetical protein